MVAVIKAVAAVLLTALLACCVKAPVGAWPESGLTLPPGSRLTYSMGGGHVHYVHFESPKSSSAVIAHIEECLRPIGYLKVTKSAMPGRSDAEYVSADGLTSIRYVFSEQMHLLKFVTHDKASQSLSTAEKL